MDSFAHDPAPLDSHLIAARRFPVVAQGFDQDQVLSFLEEIAATFHQLELRDAEIAFEARKVIDEARVSALALIEHANVQVDQALAAVDAAHARAPKLGPVAPLDPLALTWVGPDEQSLAA